MKKIWKIAALLVLLYSCAVSKELQPTQADVDHFNQSGKASVALPDLQRGLQLYVSNCGGCHNLFLPKQFSEEKWRHELPEMFEEAKVGGEEAALIERYIFAKLAAP